MTAGDYVVNCKESANFVDLRPCSIFMVGIWFDTKTVHTSGNAAWHVVGRLQVMNRNPGGPKVHDV